MKPMKLTSLMVMLLVGFSAVAQEEFFDDVYFSSSKKDKKEIIHNIITPGMIIFGILTIIIFIFERGRMIAEWDEFSHWGSVVKSMFLTNGLSVKEGSSLMFKSYPPAISIFEYFFQVINR